MQLLMHLSHVKASDKSVNAHITINVTIREKKTKIIINKFINETTLCYIMSYF